jgi:hypothetical protein
MPLDFPRARVWGAAARVPIVGRLTVNGRFLNDGAGIYRPVYVSGFTLVSRYGRDPASAQAFIEWAARLGFGGVRVMAGALTWANQTPPEVLAWLMPCLQTLRDRGLRVHLSVLTDSGIGYDVERHVDQVTAIAARFDHVTIEIANEPWHPTQSSRVHDQAFLEALGRHYCDPRGLTWAAGAPETDEPPRDPGGRYLTLHLDRGRDPFNMVRRVRELANASETFRKFVWNDEPIGWAEAAEPGRRVNDPTIAFAMGLLSRAFEVGVTSHATHGITANLPGPVQYACHTALIAGTRAIPTSAPLAFKNAGWGDSPIKGAAFDRTIVRAYSFMDASNHGYTALIGLRGDPALEFQHGFRERGTIADRGPVKLIEVSQ